jgi:hypothetical protein
MSLKINLKFAALLCDEVRHNRPKFDICRKVFFWRPCNVKIKFFTSSFQRPEFYTHLQKIKGGSPKKIFEKKNVYPKMYVELRTFDGSQIFFIIRSGRKEVTSSL